MKKIVFILTLFITTALAAGEGIHFADGTWEAIRSNAQNENKYIFLDGYTDWCYWCKVMDKTTFPNADVAELLNTKFIPVKRDMERGEGAQLSMKYHVSGFPTYLIFSPKGELVYTIVGYREPADFIAELNKALNPENHMKFPGLSAALDPGYPEFYKNSFGPSKERKPATEEQINNFLDGQKDLFSEIAWSVMWRFPLTEKYEDYLINNRDAYAKLYGSEGVNEKVQQIFLSRTKTAAESNDEKAFAKILTQVNELYPDDKNLPFSLRTSFYRTTKNWKKYAEAYENYAQGQVEPEAANYICWTLYEECDDKAILTKAVGWMKQASEQNSSYAILDTYAALLYKTGNYAEAEKQAKRAIDQGKKEDEKTDATEELLVKIKKARKSK